MGSGGLSLWVISFIPVKAVEIYSNSHGNDTFSLSVECVVGGRVFVDLEEH